MLLTEANSALVAEPGVADALAPAAAAVGRVDQALIGHPLRPAFLYRTRLEAVRRQATVDGQAIDPWHLAAVLEGLRLRMDHALRIIDRGMILDSARHALHLHGRLTSPDFHQEGDIKCAEATLAAFSRVTPLLAAALGGPCLARWGRGAAAAAGGADPALEATPPSPRPCAPDRSRGPAPGHTVECRILGSGISDCAG